MKKRIVNSLKNKKYLTEFNGRGNNVKQMLIKAATSLASMALMVTALNVNTACMLFVHQPKLPESVKKLRRF